MSDNELAVTDLQVLDTPAPGLPGNPRNRAISTWRKAFAAAVGPDDLLAVVKVLLDAARRGESWAVQDLLDRCLGKPQVSIDVSSDIESEYRYERRVAEDTRTITALLMMRDEHLSPQPHTGRPAIPAGYSAFSPCQGKKSADAQDVVVDVESTTIETHQDAPGSTPTPAPDISIEAPAVPTVLTSIAALEAARAAAAAYDADERAAYAIAAKRRGIAAAKAKDKGRPRYPCHKPGCKRRVLVPGGYCASHVLQQQRASGLTPSEWRRAEAARLAQETPPSPPAGPGVEIRPTLTVV